jgi:hypothetical protein
VFPRSARRGLAVLVVLAAAGCRSTVEADPDEWTSGRAMEVIRRVEESQVQVVREGAWFSTHGISLHDTRPGEDAGGVTGCDPSGFDDFHLVEIEGGGQSAGSAILEVLFEGLTRAEVEDRTQEREEWARYGVRRIAFADIRRVVVARKAYPLYGLLLVIGPWFYDVDLEMTDGSRITVYRWAGAWRNLLPLWLYPAQWIHTLEPQEYAEAIDYLRWRAAEGSR